MLLLMQYSVQLPGMPGGLRRVFLSARSLLALNDGGDGDSLPLLQGGPRHGESLACEPDVAVVHLEVDLAGSRQDQWGRSRSVFPIRIQIGPQLHHSPLFSFARSRAGLLSTSDKNWQTNSSFDPDLSAPSLLQEFLWADTFFMVVMFKKSHHPNRWIS